jgi:hypothetical protein
VKAGGDGVDEREWLTATDPQAMLTFLRDAGRLSARKARLFAVACCRRAWHLLTDDRSQEAVEVAERHADRSADEGQRASAAAEARRAARASFGGPLWYPARAARMAVAEQIPIPEVVRYTQVDFLHTPGETRTGELGQAEILRDLCGNPFRPVPAIDPAWLAWGGGVVGRLAEVAYEGRELPGGTLDRERLAVLADALEEAGADAALIEHLRGPGPHYRACFVVDWLTGRK